MYAYINKNINVSCSCFSIEYLMTLIIRAIIVRHTTFPKGKPGR